MEMNVPNALGFAKSSPKSRAIPVPAKAAASRVPTPQGGPMQAIERNFYRIVPKLAVEWPTIAKARRKITRAYEYAADEGWFDRCVIVKGKSRVGKSVLVAQAALEIISRREDPSKMPIAMFRWPARGSEKAFYGAFLRAIGHPIPYSKSRDEMLERLLAAKERLDIKMVIVEEAQHGARGKSREEIYYNGDVLKTLQDELMVPLVLVGVEDDLNKLLDNNPQIQGRVYDEIRLEPFDWNNAQSRADLVELLRLIDKRRLPFKTRSGLDDMAIARAIYVSTGGLIGLIIQLIQAAVDDAVYDGASRLEVHHLARTHDRLRGRAVVGPNPFEGLLSPARHPG